MNHRAPYAIRHHFSEQARRAAARVLYVDDPYTLDRGLRLPRDVYGYCPLGIALMVDRQIVPPVPSAEQVTEVLGRGDSTRTWSQAQTFIEDWERGRITDLYAALGVERRGL